MKLRQQPPRSTASDNNLMPMINVVFLLLIFFMVAGNIRVSDPLPLDAPESSGEQPLIAQSVLYVAGNGTLMIDDAPVSMTFLAAALAELKGLPDTSHLAPDDTSPEPEDTVIRKLDSKPLLAIKADSRIAVSLLRDIMNAVRDAGLSRVELITSWVPEDAR